MQNVHPLYKIIAVLCVGSVAKALFAEPRPVNTVAANVAGRVASDLSEKMASNPPKVI